MVHEILKGKIREGDTVVDATVGNGNDTLIWPEQLEKQEK